MNLYEIDQTLSENMTKLGEMLENGETPSQGVIDELLSLQEDLQNKLVNYGKFIKNTQSDIDGLDSEIKRLTAKKRALQNRTDVLKANMQIAMERHGIDKINDPIMPIRLQNSPKSLQLSVPVAELPSAFQNVEISVKTTQLKKALADGMKIHGAQLVQHKHVRIG